MTLAEKTDPMDMGLEVIDLDDAAFFVQRPPHARDASTQLEGMHRLARAFVENPGTILQELANAAVDLCGADSAGISVEVPGGSDAGFYQWVATAGRYGPFLNAILPKTPSACGLCLERGRPQLFRVSQRFFDLMKIEADTVTDGLLIPWQVDEMRGTIWVMAHGRLEAFDLEDCRLMQILGNFAAMGVRQQRQQKLLVERARTAAAADMANDLAHSINNPLQSLTNLVYLAAKGNSGEQAQSFAQELAEPLQRLSLLVGTLLAMPRLSKQTG